MPLVRGRRLVRIALAASFAIAGVAVGAVAVRHGQSAPLSPDRVTPGMGLAITNAGSAPRELPRPPPSLRRPHRRTRHVAA